MPAWGLTQLPIQFAPNAQVTDKLVHAMLHVTYCSGVSVNGQCSGSVATKALPLSGAVDLDGKCAPPTAKCTVLDALGPPKVGHALLLQATVTPISALPDQSYFFRWVVAKRPAGSSMWLPPNLPAVDQLGTLTLLPDVAGQYELACQVHLVGGGVALSYSPMAVVKFAVPSK